MVPEEEPFCLHRPKYPDDCWIDMKTIYWLFLTKKPNCSHRNLLRSEATDVSAGLKSHDNHSFRLKSVPVMCSFIHKPLHHFAEPGTRKKIKDVAASLLSNSFISIIESSKIKDTNCFTLEQGGKRNTGNTMRETQKRSNF